MSFVVVTFKNVLKFLFVLRSAYVIIWEILVKFVIFLGGKGLATLLYTASNSIWQQIESNIMIFF